MCLKCDNMWRAYQRNGIQEDHVDLPQLEAYSLPSPSQPFHYQKIPYTTRVSKIRGIVAPTHRTGNNNFLPNLSPCFGGDDPHWSFHQPGRETVEWIPP